MPEFLTNEIKEYINSFYKIKPKDLIFNFSKSYLHHEMDRGSKKAKVKRIRIHDLRHSHASLLIEMGFSPLLISDRGSKKSQVKRIRIHDLRHSHVSLLIELGFSATAIADRVGHESIDITYRYAHLFPSKQKGMALSLTQVRNNKANDWEDLLEEDDKDV